MRNKIQIASNNLTQRKMKTILKKTPWFTVITTLCLVVVTLFASGCDEKEILPEHYTVNFAGEGIDINPQSIARGNYVTAPENPKREDYDFGGWFTDNDRFIDEWDFGTDIVTQDITLYAKWEENTLQNYPIEIPFTEYSLAETSCQWVNINYGNYSFDANVIAINSSEELEEYIDCSSGSYPEIDFSKHTLLLASGRAPNGVHEISNCSLQSSNNEYQLEIRIHLEPREAIGRWIMALVVNKLSEESDIELKIIFKHP